jgi:hypothetical protein
MARSSGHFLFGCRLLPIKTQSVLEKPFDPTL